MTSSLRAGELREKVRALGLLAFIDGCTTADDTGIAVPVGASFPAAIVAGGLAFMVAREARG